MCLSDTAEYWWKHVKIPYSGKNFKHHPTHKCSHYNPSTGNTSTTPYLEDINCYECIEYINNTSTEGLILGPSPEDYYMSKKEKKLFRQQKAFEMMYGKCSCGSRWQIRRNSKTGKEFLGCLQYPKCKNTKSI